MAEIGQTLREARIRARIDISEIEAKTKIRAKYLRALENEEWGLLPGPTYTKSFLRTYAEALGLDGRALVEEYKARFERSEEREYRYPPARRREREPLPRGYLLGGALLLLVALLAIVGSLHPSGSSHPAKRHAVVAPPKKPQLSAIVRTTTTTTQTPSAVTVAVKPTARVWVCLVSEGKRLLPGVILLPEEGEATHVFHGRVFELNLGNSHVELTVNGKPVEVPPSPEPIGYRIEGSGVRPLPPGSRPTCG
jgi:cytoskeleton protein RodZ